MIDVQAYGYCHKYTYTTRPKDVMWIQFHFNDNVLNANAPVKFHCNGDNVEFNDTVHTYMVSVVPV